MSEAKYLGVLRIEVIFDQTTQSACTGWYPKKLGFSLKFLIKMTTYLAFTSTFEFATLQA
ncbi:hypothetical protein N836_15590 [Leptolyngbya sp. Heron Island J]|nr:hypothetical protein N836_15590 [Leptolyngbya sp. Heron Island J]